MYKYKETEEILSNTVNYLKSQFKEIKPEWKALLQTLGNLYDIYFLAQQDVQTRGLTIQTSKGIVANPSFKILNDTLIRIEKVFDQLAVTPKAQLKLKLVDKGESDEEFISGLIGGNRRENKE